MSASTTRDEKIVIESDALCDDPDWVVETASNRKVYNNSVAGKVEGYSVSQAKEIVGSGYKVKNPY